MPTINWNEGDLNDSQDESGATHSAVGPNPSDDYIRRGYEFGSVTKGLVAYYPFDGDVTDATPLGNDGTVNGATLNGSGQVGSNSYDFDGASDRIDTPLSANYGTGSFTVSCWVNLDDDAVVGTAGALLIGTFDGSNGLILEREGTSGETRFWLSGNPDLRGSDLTANTWQHVAGVATESEARLYIDGVLDASASRTGDIDSTEDVYIGARKPTNGDDDTDGQIDDVRIYDRPLSQPEIERLANLTDTSEVNESDTV